MATSKPVATSLSKPGKLIKLLDKHDRNFKAAKELANDARPCLRVVQECFMTHGRKPEALSEASDAPLLSSDGRHALFKAAEVAYNRHLALRLRPDDIWLTIAQGVATHINAPGNAEAFRSKFVAHEGKKELVVVQGPTPDYPAFVEDVVRLAEQNMVDTTLPAALRCDFTTTTPSSAIASRIVIMKALESYFSYSLMCMCGIPAVIMEGSLEDWERVESKIRQVESLGLGLEWWLDELKPVLAKLTATYKGEVDEEWWGRILTRVSMGSGPQYWSGWLCTFLPYDGDGKKRANVKAQLDQDKVPSGTQTVAFKLTKDGKVRKMELLAGFLGCTVDAAEGSIAPCIGWAVAEDARVAEVREIEAAVASVEQAVATWCGNDSATAEPALPDAPGDGSAAWRLAQMRRVAAAANRLQRCAELQHQEQNGPNPATVGPSHAQGSDLDEAGLLVMKAVEALGGYITPSKAMAGMPEQEEFESLAEKAYEDALRARTLMQKAVPPAQRLEEEAPLATLCG